MVNKFSIKNTFAFLDSLCNDYEVSYEYLLGVKLIQDILTKISERSIELDDKILLDYTKKLGLIEEI